MEFELATERDAWKNRRDWLNDQMEQADNGGCNLVSNHATALFMDMQIAFCAGAWISVVVMSVSTIDAHLRETEAMDNKIGTAKLLSSFYEGENIDWLRQMRNRYVHHNIDKPAFEMNEWFDNQVELESNAYTAMKMTISALFQGFGV